MNQEGKKIEVSIWEKANLTVEEAALYSGIGRNKIRQITDREDCPFVLWVGAKRLIKRKNFLMSISKRHTQSDVKYVKAKIA